MLYQLSYLGVGILIYFKHHTRVLDALLPGQLPWRINYFIVEVEIGAKYPFSESSIV